MATEILRNLANRITKEQDEKYSKLLDELCLSIDFSVCVLKMAIEQNAEPMSNFDRLSLLELMGMMNRMEFLLAPIEFNKNFKNEENRAKARTAWIQIWIMWVNKARMLYNKEMADFLDIGKKLKSMEAYVDLELKK